MVELPVGKPEGTPVGTLVAVVVEPPVVVEEPPEVVVVGVAVVVVVVETGEQVLLVRQCRCNMWKYTYLGSFRCCCCHSRWYRLQHTSTEHMLNIEARRAHWPHTYLDVELLDTTDRSTECPIFIVGTWNGSAVRSSNGVAIVVPIIRTIRIDYSNCFGISNVLDL